MTKRVIAVVGVLTLIAVLSVVAVGTALAQGETPGQATPTTPTTPTTPRFGFFGHGFGLFGKGQGTAGGIAMFDEVAKALNMTPTQLFEQLHSGKSLEEIATAQGVDLTAVQEALKASRLESMKKAIADAVTNGQMTQEQADWLLQGIEKGYMPGGRGFDFGFGFGHRGGHGMMGGMRGMRGFDKGNTPTTPATPAPGTSS
jgi:hypothetical protein